MCELGRDPLFRVDAETSALGAWLIPAAVTSVLVLYLANLVP